MAFISALPRPVDLGDEMTLCKKWLWMEEPTQYQGMKLYGRCGGLFYYLYILF